jgi:hypothetical protein
LVFAVYRKNFVIFCVLCGSFFRSDLRFTASGFAQTGFVLFSAFTDDPRLTVGQAAVVSMARILYTLVQRSGFSTRRGRSYGGIELEGLPAGSYFLIFKIEGKSVVAKVQI